MKNYSTAYLLVMIVFIVLACDDKNSSVKNHISGTVKTDVGDSIVGGAAIFTNPASSDVFSDSFGIFQIDNVADGFYLVITSKEGFHNDSVSVEIQGKSIDNISFKLNRIPTLPQITTSPVSNITTTTAVSGGSIISTGGLPILGRGICWSLNPNPTTEDSVISGGTGVGNFVSYLKGLASNTTYYLRAYATNDVGTVYGNEIAFNTASPQYKILFTKSTQDMGSEIFVINQDGTGPLNISNKFNHDDDPIWSPTGRVAYISFSNPVSIMTVKHDGTNEIKLDIGVSANDLYGYSPDGSKILFMGGSHNDLMICDSNGANIETLTSFVDVAKLSPDGQKVALTQFHIVDYRHHHLLMVIDLVSNTVDTVANDTGITFMTWIDNNSIAYCGDDGYTGKQKIQTVNLNTHTTTRIASSSGGIYYLCYGKYSQLIYYYDSNLKKIISINNIGGNIKEIVTIPYFCASMTLSDDDTHLAYSAYATLYGYMDIFIVGTDGTGQIHVPTASTAVCVESWSLNRY